MTTSWSARGLEDLLEGGGPPPEQPAACDIGVTRLFYARRINGLFGDSESGKTMLAVVALMQEVRAGNPVVVIDFEDSREGWARTVTAFGATRDEAARIRYISPQEPLNSAQARVDLTVAMSAATLAIVDGVEAGMTLHDLNPNYNKDIARFYRLVARPGAEVGAAVVVIDHVIKDPEKRRSGPTGGLQKRAGISGAAFEVVLLTEFARGREGRSLIRLDKDRPGGIRALFPGRRPAITNFVLDSTTSTSVWRFEQPVPDAPNGETEWQPTHLMESISRFLEAAGEPQSQNKIEKGVEGRANWIRKALDHLVKGGFVLSYPNGRTKLHSVTTPYRQIISEVRPASSLFVPDASVTHSSASSPSSTKDEGRRDEVTGDDGWDETDALAAFGAHR